MAAPGAWVVRLLVVLGCVGCGGSLQHGSPSSGTDGGPVGGGGSNAQSPPRAAACGGTVAASGTTPYGSFDAHYIYARLGQGDCGDFTMTIAQTDRPDSDSFSLSASPQPDGSRLGTTTGTGWYAVPGVFEHSYTDVSATVTITSFPNPVPSDLRDAGDDLVVGSFAIDASGFSVTGTFSTPICAFNLCV